MIINQQYLNHYIPMDHPNRLPMTSQQATYMIPNHHFIPQSPHFNLVMSPYPMNAFTGPIPPNSIPPSPIPPSPAMISPIRVPNDIGIRQQYDPQNQTTPIPPPANLSQPPGSKQPMSVPSPATMAQIPATPHPVKRESRGIPIVDPVTKKPLTKDELLRSPTTPLSQSSKDSGAPRISSQDHSDSSDRKSLTDDALTKSSSDSTSSDKSIIKESEVVPSQTIETKNKLAEPKLEEKLEEDIPTSTTTQIVIEEKVTENGETESIDEDSRDLTDGIAAMSISSDDKPSEEKTEDIKPDIIEGSTPVKKQTLLNLPYAAGQFSPLNPNGSKKYSIEFLKALGREMKIDFEPLPNPRVDQFAPHYVNQVSGSYRDYPSSQPLMRRSSQQVMAKPKKIIVSHSLQQEVELKTAEKPWKPELEVEKTKINEHCEMDTKRLLKVFRGHLNKLTPQKYDSLIEKIGALDLNGPERLNSVIDLVFDKAVDEPGFCELYARMCKVIASKDSQFCFHLVKKCQDEFETSDLYDGLNVEDRKQNIEQETDVAKKKLMSEELYEDMRLRRKKYLGTIKLIGEMYKLGLLAAKIIGFCMSHLINEASNENIECLCSLIATVGFNMANEVDDNIKTSLKATLNVLQDLAHSKRTDEFALESRIKFKILDTIDLSRRNWRPRMVENNPKKIEEIREEAKEEFMRQQHHSHPNQAKTRGTANRWYNNRIG